MKDDSRMRALMATALVLALAAMLAGPAAARPIDLDGKELTASERQTLRPDDKAGPLGVGAIAEPELAIPYLSHGVGVDESQFSGLGQSDTANGTQPATRPDDKGGLQSVGAIAEPELAVPYLSHGVGVDESQFSGTEPSSPATGTQAPQSDDDSGWRGTSTFGVAMAAVLLAAMALLAVRRRQGGSIVT